MRLVRLVAVVTLLVGLMASAGAATAAPAYRYYVVCSHSKQAPPATSCSKNSNKGAVFKSNNAAVKYKICVKYPGGQKLCANNQNAPKGRKVLNTISSSLKGVHTVKWWVDGDLVGTYNFTVT